MAHDDQVQCDDEYDDSDVNMDSELSPVLKKTKHVAARLVVKACEEYHIPQSTLFQDITSLCSSTLDDIKDNCLHEINEHNSDIASSFGASLSKPHTSQ